MQVVIAKNVNKFKSPVSLFMNGIEIIRCKPIYIPFSGLVK